MVTRRIGIGLALIALLIAVYVGVWFGSAAIVKSHVARWIEAQQQAGLTITHNEPRLSGFPTRINVTYGPWSVASPASPEGWTWHAPQIELSANPLTPLRFTVDLAGTHSVTSAWALVGGMAQISAERAELQPTLGTDGKLTNVAVNISALKVESGNTTLLSLESGALALRQDRAADTEQNTWHLDVDLSNVGAPELGHIGAFANTIKAARLKLDLTGALPPGSLPNALAAWREDGGTLEVRTLELDWPPLVVSANGTIALSDKLQPVGAMSAKFQGFFEAVDSLAARGLVRSGEANIARVVLGLLARPTQDGSPPEINLSVTIQDGKLYTGPLKLMDIQLVSWPPTIVVP